jgi:hypothetical protein
MARFLVSPGAVYALTVLLSLLFACLVVWARECP